jgi:hypothetical protein
MPRKGGLCQEPGEKCGLAEIPRLRREMADVGGKIRQLIDEDLPKLNKSMNDAGVPHLSVATRPQDR